MLNASLFIDALLFGFVVILLGSLVSALMPNYFKVPLPEECKDWNKKHSMEIILGLTGVLSFLVAKFVGI